MLYSSTHMATVGIKRLSILQRTPLALRLSYQSQRVTAATDRPFDMSRRLHITKYDRVNVRLIDNSGPACDLARRKLVISRSVSR